MPKESPLKDSLIREISIKVTRSVRRHGLFEPGQRVVVGCSGGADSTCLLHILTVGLAHLRLQCTAVYVDHGLRPDTSKEQELVRRLARKLGASFVAVKVDVPGYVNRERGSVQDAARNLRYWALRGQASTLGAQSIAVGHTQSDQAETLLLQLLRGAGSTGLSAMAPRLGMIVRPLLDIEREDTETYCRYYNLDWFQDPSNKNRHYMRSRVRHDLIPHLKQFNSRIVQGLSRTADVLRAEDEYLDAVARREFKKLVRSGSKAPGAASPMIMMDVDKLRALPLALKRRVLRLAVMDAAEESGGISFEQVEDIIRLVESDHSGGKTNVSGGIWAIREYDQLLLVPTVFRKAEKNDPGDPFSIGINIGDTVKVPWADLRIKVEAVEGDLQGSLDVSRQSPSVAMVNRDALVLPLFVRTRRPGDRLSPLGLGGEKKVKDLMIDKKVPPRWRDTIPIVCDQKGIVWVAGLALAERVKLKAGTRRLIRLEVVSEDRKRP